MKKWTLSLAAFFLLAFSMHASSSEFENTPKLIAKGEASIYKPSDQMEISLGVVTSSEKSNVALNDNNQRMHQVIAHLQGLGLNESDYQTGRFAIRPIYQKPPKNSLEYEGKISRYEVSNTIQIKTSKIDLVDKIIEGSVKAGANQVNQVNFNLTNPQTYRSEAIQAAAKNAFEDATALANSTGVKIKRILSLALDHWQQYPAPVYLSKSQEYSSADSAGEVFEPGKTEIHATVNVVYEIE